MSSYIQDSLIRDEKVLLSAKPSLWNFTKSIIFGVLLSLGSLPTLSFPDPSFLVIAFGPGLILSAYLRYRSIELAVTNQRVIAKFGFIQRRTVELKLDKIESLQVEQSVLGRMLNFGDVRIAGAGSPQAPIPGITDPMQFKKKLNQIMEDLAP